ncbi:MAG: NUDIX hydrolase, partial [Anaerolineales bacterium]
KLPDGQVIPDWHWLVTPDYVIVVALTAGGEYLCFRQVKYGVDGTTLAPVGGYIETGEEPLAAAKRELMEEMGCTSEEWVDMGSYRVDGNHGAGMAYLFLARNVRFEVDPSGNDLEEQQLIQLSRLEMQRAMFSGQFKVLSWATAIAMALSIDENTKRWDANG